MYLARRSGVTDRQIRSLSSASPPKTIRLPTLAALAGALGCKKEELATLDDDRAGRSRIASPPVEKDQLAELGRAIYEKEMAKTRAAVARDPDPPRPPIADEDDDEPIFVGTPTKPPRATARAVQVDGAIVLVPKGVPVRRAPMPLYEDEESIVIGRPHAAPARNQPDEIDEAIVLPAMGGTLAARAQRERALELHDLVVVLPSGTFDLMTLDRFKRCLAQPKSHDGRRFVVEGTPDEYMGIGTWAAKALDAAEGIKFRVVRWVAPRLPIYVTVFARAAQAEIIMRHLDGKKSMTLLVRHVYKATEGRNGFILFEKPPKARPFGFIVEEIIAAAP